VWPLAILEVLRSQREGSLWMRLHSRQAVVFGALASVAFVVLFSVPLIVSLFVFSSTGAIIVLYSIALGVDGLFGLSILVMAISYSVRASRGELFDIPVATAISGRIFPIQRPDREG
jgi:uncharacterized membrane protein